MTSLVESCWVYLDEKTFKCWISLLSYEKTRCVRETQMPPIMANSKDGQGHKDKYLDTSRKILSQEMLMYNMKALIFTFVLKNNETTERSYHKEYSCEI